ncbi:MAG TPA: biotin/lipoyl-containing protein, partial [Burkholderiales bacterium]|nr:biotin/lipoyl-containing protein [Burkholderiales bacterium]
MAIIEVKVPQLSESVAEATLLDWHKKEGEPVRRDENLIDIETDKVVLELPAPADGVLVRILKKARDSVGSGDVIAQIDTEAKAGAAPAPASKPAPAAQPAAPAQKTVMPAAQKIASEQGVDTSKIQGTGRDGRVTKGDVLAASQKAVPQEPRPALQQPAPPVNLDQLLSGRPEQRVPMSRLRQRVAERLVQSQSTAAILTTFN